MIVWLASYPRSGNTMLRMMFKAVFNVETYSKYNDLKDIGADENTTRLVGHKMLHDNWDISYQRMQISNETFFMKTHDSPEDDSKAIYVVRDGRAAIISFKHYLKKVAGKNCSLIELIVGYGVFPFTSWGGHLDVWDPLSRPNTLLIKYENLLMNPSEEIERISKFTGLNIVGNWTNDFESFQKINPNFFRQGSASRGIDALNGNELETFWLFNGDWMKTLGYINSEEEFKYSPKMIREATREVIKKMTDELDIEKNILKEQIGSLKKSLSWKMTAPAREIVNFLRKQKTIIQKAIG